MKQSRKMSALESAVNILVGFAIACCAQGFLFKLFGIPVSIGQNLSIGGFLTLVSFVRSYTLRRIFEEIRLRQFLKHNEFIGEVSMAEVKK